MEPRRTPVSSRAVPAGERSYVQSIRAAPDAETKIAIEDLFPADPVLGEVDLRRPV